MVSINNFEHSRHILALVKYSGVAPRLFKALLQHFGNIERIVRADSGSLMAIEGMNTRAANRIARSSEMLGKANRYLKKLADRDIHVITRFDEKFPDLLDELNDPPPLLYVRGSSPGNDFRKVALIGTDDGSASGIEQTVDIARTFARAGVAIISSLNTGIDAAAHIGVRAGEGASFAVLNSGFDNIDPAENIPLAIDIVQKGGLLSEYPPEQKIGKRNDLNSGRIIAGIAQAVVVTEFYHDSVRILDILKFCSQIGKLTFVLIDPTRPSITDQAGLNKAVVFGAIPMVGLDSIDDIVKSLI